MATARTRRGRTPARTALEVVRWIWAAGLSLFLIVVGLALVGSGALFAVVGVEAVLRPEDAGHVIAGVLFAVLGLAAFVGGITLAFRWRSKVVLKLSGRKPPTLGDGSSAGGYFGGGGSFFGGDGGGGCGGGDGGGGGGC